MSETNSNILDKVIRENKSEFSPKETANALVDLLSSREIEILKQRYGFEIEKPKTLEAIGKQMNLTRERVRQLENTAIKNILKHTRYDEIASPTKKFVLTTLEQFGDFVSIDELIDELNKLSKNQENEKNVIKFLLKNFMAQTDVVRDKNFKPSLRSFEMPLDFVVDVLEQLEKVLTKENNILEIKEIVDKFKNSEYYKTHSQEFSILLNKNNNNLKKIILSYLRASRKFIETPMKQWGLTDWEIVNPRRISGRVYLVLLAKKKPMHFTEIADVINKSWTEKRDIKAATVHNELIADKRFVLVGKGTYALKEWGYDSRSTEDLIKDIIAKNKDITDEQIIKKVLDKKMVKESTIKTIISKVRK